MARKSTAKDFSNMRHGLLTAIVDVGYDGRNRLWKMQCDCGKTIIMPSKDIGRRRSCGCKSKEFISRATRTHGMSYKRPWNIWRGMIARCYYKAHPQYKDYGGRGIVVCDYWQQNFSNFWKEMELLYSEDLVLDRVNNSLGYYKENCRWVTWNFQNQNRRDNVKVETPWGLLCVSEAARRAGLCYETLLRRVNEGWAPADLFREPSFLRRR